MAGKVNKVQSSIENTYYRGGGLQAVVGSSCAGLCSLAFEAVERAGKTRSQCQQRIVKEGS